ncbi:MAG: hypothetical protein DRH57_03650 [Candidatus Cloacimonadota bacterium]|nr:MAG: hypothetical protein DRH57_03650 [Candidatus Cloacimonadota bacterium]
MEIKHIAVESNNKDDANLFYGNILGLEMKYSYKLNKDLCKKIFGISDAMDVIMYGNENINFEIFVNSNYKPFRTFQHICIQVENKADFISKCHKNNAKVNIIIKEDGKELYFVRDFSGNLFEVKF